MMYSLPHLSILLLLFLFLFFFYTDDQTSAPDVFSSYLFISCEHFDTCLVMISYYDYFSTGFNDKNKVRGIQKTLSMCYFTCIAQKNIPFSVFDFFSDFKILAKCKIAAKMPTSFGDVTGVQQLHHP